MKIVKMIALILAVIICMAGSVIASEPVQLSLQKAIELSLQNNPDLKKMIYAQKTSQANLAVVKAANYPTVSVGLGANPSVAGDCTSGTSTASASINASLNATYQLYDGGNTAYSIKQAETVLTEAGWNVEKQKQSLKYDTTKAYYEVINTANQLKVQEKAFATANEHLNVTKVKYEEGAVPKGDVLSTIATVSTSRQTLIVARNACSKALLTLKNTMNVPGSTSMELTEHLTVPERNLDPAGLHEYAERNNPELILAQLAVEADEYSQKISESGNYPSVALTASGTHGYNPNFDNGYTYSTNVGINVGASVSFDLFDGYKTVNQVEAAGMQIQQEKQAFESLKLSSNLAVSSAIDDIGALLELINATQSSLASAQEDLEIKQVRYASGVGTNIDVIDAQKNLTTNWSSYWEAVYKYNLALAYLDKVIGVPVK